MSSKVINIYQDYSCDLSHLSRQGIVDIQSLGKIIGQNNVRINIDKQCQIMHYVGFASINNTNLQILPKIYRHINLKPENEKDEALKFLFRLLRWTDYFTGVKMLNAQLVDKFDGDLFEIFIHIFIKEFLKLFNQQVVQEYQKQEGNQQFIKGKILFSETIRHNPFTRHQHYVRYDEFTIDNPLNRIFKAVIKNLITTTQHIENKKLLKRGLSYLEEISFIHLTASLFKSIRFNRMNSKYEPVFNLAKLFYFNQQPGLTSGSENTFSFLISIHDLYEKLIFKLLKSTYGNSYKILHEPHTYLARYDTSKAILLKPDFVVKNSGETIKVLDAKYKRVLNPNNEKEAKAKREDIYQMVAYSVHYGCPDLTLIYPKFKGLETEENHLLEYLIDTPYSDSSIKLHLVHFDITLETYEEVLKEFREALKMNSNI
jgi:5-methylcytosine-specific restriction enzyme subunit McrC